MSQISREEAIDIARKDISMVPHIEITDQWNEDGRSMDLKGSQTVGTFQSAHH